MVRAIILAAALCGAATAAYAHDWYSGTRDPVTNGGCCGGSDCRDLVVRPGMLTPEADGIRVILTAEEAKRINPARPTGFNAVIPMNRVQDSQDGNFAICLKAYGPEVQLLDGWYCFFAPPNT